MIQRMEGLSRNVDEALCVGYGECMTVCVFCGMEIENGIGKINQEKCLGSGQCERVCPNNVITISLDDPKQLEEFIKRIEKIVDVS
jgi:electron transport complex protein RnfB